jgi:hypothetical protein
MPSGFEKNINYNKKTVLAVILPQLRQNGMHFEVNIKGQPRFYMAWSPLGRYDVAPGQDVKIPYELILAVSDAIEENVKKNP